MQRVRIGLTGLACVFLLVLLAAAMLGIADPGAAPGDPVATNAAASRNEQEAPREPLAELGVAPGNAPVEGTTNATQPLPDPPQRRGLPPAAPSP